MSNLSPIILAFCALLLSEQSHAANTLHRFVLAAGANDGGRQRVELRYAVSDAVHFSEVLQAMGGVAAEDAILLSEPTVEEIGRGFDALRQHLEKVGETARTEIVFYYSGHADQDGLLLGEKRLSYQALRAQLDAMPADVRIAVLDACASGAMTRLKGGKLEKAFLVDESNAMRGHAFLTSSSADESAQESDRIEASFFTHYLVSGLRGAADVSGDGRVSLSEAYQFAFDQTLERTTGTLGGAQHPAYDIELSGTGGVIMTDMNQTTTSLTLGEGLNGRIYVRDENRRLVAELLKPAGRQVELGLGTGSYEIRYERIEELGLVEVALNSGEKRELNEWDFTPTALEETAMRGGATTANRVEFQDGLDISFDEDYTVSLGFFLNRQREDFNGLQLALVNMAHQRAGTQLAPLLNVGRGKLYGMQAAGVANIGGDVRSGQFAGVSNIAEQVGGPQLAGVANIAEQVGGPQLAGVANITKQVRGPQLAGVANIAQSVHGPQLAGVSNSASQAAYLQMAGVSNIAKQVKGPQLAGVANIAQEAHGPQLAGVVNISKDTKGPQLAGVVNTAIESSQTQLAGVANIAQKVSGVQISGVVNIAQKVNGAQIGLINLSQHIDGITLGLFSYSHTGRLAVSTWVDGSGMTWMTASSGSRNVYSLYSVGIGWAETDQPIALGLGVGAQFPVGQQRIEVDAIGYRVSKEGNWNEDNTLGRLRVSGVRRGTSGFSQFAGVALDLLWHGNEPILLSQPGTIALQTHDDQRLGLGLFAGVSYHR